MSDSFFNQSASPPQQTASLKSRNKTRAAPPPPPPAAAARRLSTHNPSAASSSYYGNSASTQQQQQQQQRSTAPPPPQRPVQQPSQTAAAATANTSHSAPSFYGTSSTTNNRTAGGYAASSNNTGTSYYGTPAPAAYASTASSATPTTSKTSSFANTNTTAPETTNQPWHSTSGNANANTSDWYSAPQQPQQSQYPSQPQQPQPAYTDFSQSSFPTTTPLNHTTELAGSIGSTSQQSQQQFSTFIPQPATMQSTSNIYEEDFGEEEAPLLEELGVNLQHIFLKTRAVVLPFSKFGMQSQQVLHEDDNDLAGPLVFALLLGGELLLSGKLQFSYIYGFCSLGCLFLTLVLNLMSPLPVSIWTVASILGYALLPVNILAIFKILLVDLIQLNKVGHLLAILTICWCTVASTRLLEQKCGMRAQRYLLAYPIALLYSAFVMITIF